MPSGSCFRARCGLYISRFDAIMSARTGWGRGEANKFEIPTVVNGFSNGRGGRAGEGLRARPTRGHDNANIMTTLPRVNRSAASVPIVFCARVQVQRFRIRCSSFLPFARRTRSFAGAEFSSRFSFFF